MEEHKHSPIFLGIPIGAQPAVDIQLDLIHKPAYTINSWFMIGHLQCNGMCLSYLVHLFVLSIKGISVAVDSAVSVTSEDINLYRVKNNLYSMLRSNVSRNQFHVQAPNALICGTLENIVVRAEIENISIDLKLKAYGYPLYNKGSGRFDMLGMDVFQYSIPTLNTTGTIKIDEKTYSVSGPSWFDRQWQKQSLGPPKGRWTWMDLNLSNGWFISLWDATDEKGVTDSWVTVVDAQGKHQVYDLEPLAMNSFDLWQSAESGSRFPTRWIIKVLSLDIELEVIAKPHEQEVVGTLSARYEGACNIKGTVGTKPVIGQCYVEMVGNWKPSFKSSKG